MSGSDLAQFVATVLKDRALVDMQQELEALRSKLKDNINKQLLVQITGPNGQPVYFEESLKNHEPAYDGQYCIRTQIHYDEIDCMSTDVELTIDSIFGGLEIRLGGNVVERFNKDTLDILGMENPVQTYAPEHRDELEWENYVISPKRDSQLYGMVVSFGPMTLTEYETLRQRGRMDIPEFIERFTTSGGRGRGQQRNTVRIESLYFRKENIGGSLSTILNELLDKAEQDTNSIGGGGY